MPTDSASRQSVTKTVELPFYDDGPLRNLSTRSAASTTSIVSLAWSVVLKDFYQDQSTALLVDHGGGLWRRLSRVVTSNESVSQALESRDHNSSSTETVSPEDLEDHVSFAMSAFGLNGKTNGRQSKLQLRDVQQHASTIIMLLQLSKDQVTDTTIISIEYEASDVADWEARSLLSATRCALVHIINNPSKLLSDIQVVDKQGAQSFLEWNNRLPATVDRTVHDMILDRTHIDPSAIAIDAWDGQLSYMELHDASRKLAYRLSQQGVGSESRVSLYFEKSKWYTVALLAVLQAGGAFVPLDPSQPQGRLSYIVHKTASKIVICSPSLSTAATALSSHVIVLDEQWMTEASATPLAWSPKVEPSNLAYIMFTSGSTGNPKGVMIEHSACCSSAVHHGRASNMSSQTRALQFARHTFDASIAEIISTLIHGGCIVVPSEEQKLNNVTAVIQDKRVNWMFATPSVLRLLEPSDMPLVQDLVAGGEQVSQDVIHQWSLDRNLYNGYGPTENTVFSVFHRFTTSSNAVVLGRGVGTVCWVTDPDNPHRLLPPGATGELILESPQLARGYLGYAENEGPNSAFITDPPWLMNLGRRGRLYRSGDLCYTDDNGFVHMVGRKDTQLKIAGQRLEAREVETHLIAAFGTSDIVVDAIERPGQTTSSDKILVAYVALTRKPLGADNHCISRKPDRRLQKTIPDVEAQIAENLANWMIPSVYVPISSVPLTANGKTDLKRLRNEVSQLSADDFNSFMENEEAADTSDDTDNVVIMKRLWGEVLGRKPESLSRGSHFFRSGGDSISAMKLVAAARRENLRLKVAEVFTNPCLGDLAHIVIGIERSDDTVVAFELIHHNSEILQEAADECAVDVANIEDAYPCTPLQEGLFALSASKPGAYFAQHVLELPEDIVLNKLRAAWEEVFQTHGMLRTRLVQTMSNGLLQVVVKEEIAWQPSSGLEDYLKQDQNHLADSGQPLNRFAIVHGGGSGLQMVWSAHHSVIDGHSVGLTLQHVRDAYHGFQAQAGPPMSVVIRHNQQTSVESAAEFWGTKLGKLEASSFPKLPSATYSPQPNAHYRSSLKIDLNGCEYTASTVLRAAWALVLGIFSGSDDTVFGVISSGRNNDIEGLDRTCGPTISTVPLRVRCQKDMSVAAVLGAVQQYAVDMIPFEQSGLPAISRIHSDCRAACEFQSIMVFQPEVDMAIDGHCFSGYGRPQELGHFNAYAIMIECNLGKDNISLTVSYDDQVVSQSQTYRLVEYFKAGAGFLTSGGGDRTIRDFGGHTIPSDIASIQSWNPTHIETDNSCVHHLFERNIVSQPEAQAIFAWDGELTFAALDLHASRLARVLHDKGVGPEIKVPYCFEKSKHTIIAMLAILKAGGTIVPLDPKHPHERRSHAIKAVKAHVVLCSRDATGLFSEEAVEAITVDDNLFETLQDQDVKGYSSTVTTPNTSATVLFTSGTTGTPKGVVQDHFTLCSIATAQGEVMKMGKGTRAVQMSNHVFDMSIIEIVDALILGACLCIPSEEDKISDLAGFIARSQAEWVFFTPSFAQTLDPSDLSSLKTVLFGGEVVPEETVNAWAPYVSVINAYGPAEASLCVSADLTDGKSRIDSIGRPVNCFVWLTDPDDDESLMPVGAVGELLIEGPDVARGYLENPEKTAKSFIREPSWRAQFSGPRFPIYKTGDLARYLPDGSLQYLVRKDKQIRLRGQRVELEEIEHHLRQNLASGAVVAVEAVSLAWAGERTLAAFIEVAHDQKSFDKQRFRDEMAVLRKELGRLLPIYMIPHVFLPIDAMPLTINGKLDRKRLQDYAGSLSLGDIQDVTSSSDAATEMDSLDVAETVALDLSSKIADLLSVRNGEYGSRLRNKNFNPYQAGMDSIQVISIATYVRKTYNVVLPISKYMDSKATIRDMARWIEDEQRQITQDQHLATKIDLLQEIEKYDAQIPRLLSTPVNAVTEEPGTFFLTGATGFLGSQILRQLLQSRATIKVIALVRGRDPAHATHRMQSLCRASSWWRPEYQERVEVWHGDLSKPKLDLDENQWARLCCDENVPAEDRIEAIIHNGAMVYWMADYDALTAANIMSTVELLKAVTQAAQRGHPVRFAYVSGGHLSTAPDVIEDIAEELVTYPAYSQTKFVAEVLVKRFGERLEAAGTGQAVSIVKPGLVLGSSEDGIANTDDFIWRVVASSLQLGLHNGKEGEAWIAAAGADAVAQAIIESCVGIGTEIVEKLLHGMTMAEFWDLVHEETGMTTEGVDASIWVAALREDVEAQGETHELFPVMHVLEDKKGNLGQPLNGLSTQYQNEKREKVCEALRKSLRYLMAIGYISSTPAEHGTGENSQLATPASTLMPGTPIFSRTSATPSWEKGKEINIYERALKGLV